MTSALEYAAADERLFDFCLWEYAADAPCIGKLRSVNLLRRSFEAQGLDCAARPLVEAIRRGLGDSRTVWGIKREADKVSWELYFYDYARLERERSIPRVLDVLRPWVPCDVVTSERHPYFMFSIDLEAGQISHQRPIDEIQMYIGNVGSQVSSGVCYGVTARGTELKNFYFFFDARAEAEAILGKVAASAYLDGDLAPDDILWPELRDCRTIVVANKRDRDGVYFCRIRVRQLIAFMKRLEYPRDEVDFVENRKNLLDHMLYDVGFDYRVEAGRLRIVKSAYYGVF